MTKPCERPGCNQDNERDSPYCSTQCYQRVYFSARRGKYTTAARVEKAAKRGKPLERPEPKPRPASKKWLEVTRPAIVAMYGVKLLPKDL